MFEVIDLTGQTFFGLGTQFDPLLNCPPVGDAEWTGFSAPTEAILLSCIGKSALLVDEAPNRHAKGSGSV